VRSYYYKIAGLDIQINIEASDKNDIGLLPSFAPFRQKEAKGDLLFTLTVDDKLKPAEGRSLVRNFDTGNGDTLV